MCKDQEEYDVLQDLNETNCNISFGQLLNVSPKVRSQVSQGFKLEKPEKKIIGALNNTIAAATLVKILITLILAKVRKPQKKILPWLM